MAAEGFRRGAGFARFETAGFFAAGRFGLAGAFAAGFFTAAAFRVAAGCLTFAAAFRLGLASVALRPAASQPSRILR